MNGRAVIVGGGIGGLLAAHALARRFGRVSILERDRYPTSIHTSRPLPRKGAPQSRCLHMLTAAGIEAINELVPGWSAELVASGAIAFDVSADAAMRFPAGWLPRGPSGITSYASSRALLERVLRETLWAHASIEILENASVVGLSYDEPRNRVTGVRARIGKTESADIEADLVIDASGSASALPKWLGTLPSSPGVIDETLCWSGTHCVSRWFHIPPPAVPDWICLSIAPVPARPLHSAMMLRAENDCWGVVLIAPADEPLPASDASFLDVAAALGEGQLRDALAHATPISPIYQYGPAFSRMRHFERMTLWPSGLVALGDAVCTLDPFFGLGMTLTARGAALLGRHVDATVSGSTLAFQQELSFLNAEPWSIATGLALDGGDHAAHRRVDELNDKAHTGPAAARAALEARHLLHSRERAPAERAP
ncbi:MAG: FAD-dependent oxidoreductase [Gemmatimonadaceae bacterium]